MDGRGGEFCVRHFDRASQAPGADSSGLHLPRRARHRQPVHPASLRTRSFAAHEYHRHRLAADLVGLTGGFIVSYFTLRIGAVEFWTRALNALEFSDLMQGMAKPVIFAFLLATIGCYKGLTVRGGTQGVGRATTQAVVVSSVSILVSDFFLTKFALFLAGKPL